MTRLPVAATGRPCPVCGWPYGFHDHDAPVSLHRAHVVPRGLVRPSQGAARAAQRLGRVRGHLALVQTIADPQRWPDTEPPR